MDWMQIVSAVLGLTCVFLAGRNSKSNFYVGYANNISLFVLYLTQRNYSIVILQIVALVINAFGHYRWTHPKEEERSSADEKKLKVGQVDSKTWPGLILITWVFAVAWAMFLERFFPSDSSPWLGSFVMMTSFLAQYLSAQKLWQCWIVWLVVNALYLIMNFYSGLYVMCGVNALYIANGIWSLITWKKLHSRNE